MARFLFAPIAASGHVNPATPIAAELVRRGQEVRWYTSPRFERKVRDAGARYVPYTKGIPLREGEIDQQFPERVKLKGLQQMKYDMRCFISLIPGLYEDVVEEIRSNRPDVIVGCTASHACGLAAQIYGVPWAVCGVSVLIQSSRDTAPFGLGMPPATSFFGRMRNSFLYWLVHQLVFKDPFAFYGETVEKLGAGKSQHPMLEFSRAADLFLQGCVPAFEYPRSDMPENVRFIGSAIPPVPPDWRPPEWWPRMDSGKPVVLATQGTVATNYAELLIPTIRALAGEDVLLIVTTGSRPAAELGLDSIPANVIVEQFVPYARLMPRVSLLVTNGGYGTVQIALAHGVPMVVFAGSEEKPEVARRVTWSGVGVGRHIKQPSPDDIRTCVKTVLDTPSYSERSRKFAEDMRQYDTPSVAATLLESLIASKASLPVRSSSAAP
jgi:MGT family glycosyltransferase